MSTYNVGAIIDDVVSRAKDASLVRTSILRSVNDTQNLILGRYVNPQSESEYVEQFSTGTLTIPLEDDMQSVSKVSVEDSTDNEYVLQYMIPADFFAVDIDDTRGTPTIYTIYGRDLYVNCALDKTYTFTMKYISSPSQLESETDVPSVPVEFKESLTLGGLAGVEEERGNFDIAAIYRRRIEDIGSDYKRRYRLSRYSGGRKAFRSNDC